MMCGCGNQLTASYWCRSHGYVCAQHRDDHLREQTLRTNYRDGLREDDELRAAQKDER
jgi:hypothetical protein